MESIVVYADGGCSGNPGPGAWAAIIISDHKKIHISGSEYETTNNRMELKAVIKALYELSNHSRTVQKHIEIYTDSQYVKKGITEWIKTWEKNGWKNAGKKPVKNQDLWKELKSLSEPLDIGWNWIKGHGDDKLNIECDMMVQEEIKKILKEE